MYACSHAPLLLPPTTAHRLRGYITNVPCLILTIRYYMKLSPLLVLGICLASVPSGLADPSDPLSITYSYARTIARDVRTSWRHFSHWQIPERRHVLTKRASSNPGKCQLRLAAAFNSTSPSDSHHSPSRSSSLPSSTLKGSSSTGSAASSSSYVRTSGAPTTATGTSSGTRTSSTSSAASTYPTSIFNLKQLHVRRASSLALRLVLIVVFIFSIER